MNKRRSMGTLKTGLRAQRTNSSTSGPTSANRMSKLPKPASGATSSTSRGRSGSMDRPRASLAAFSDFKTPRLALTIIDFLVFFYFFLSAEANRPWRVPRWATFTRILLPGILEVHCIHLPTQWWNGDEVRGNEAQCTEWADSRVKIIDRLATKIGKRK